MNPNLSAAASRVILKVTAQKFGAEKDDFFGNGMPNIPQAVAVARSFSSEKLQREKNRCKGDLSCFEERISAHARETLKKADYPVVDLRKSKCGEKPQLTATVSMKALVDGADAYAPDLDPSKGCTYYACEIERLNLMHLLTMNTSYHVKFRSLLCKEFVLWTFHGA